MRRVVSAAVLPMIALTGCAGDTDDTRPLATPVESAVSERLPEILAADATFDPASGTWTFAVTVSSPYDTPEQYADGWRVLGPDGAVYGVHTLTHDHAAEQPFTRRQTGVAIPDGVSEVTIEGRDIVNGFGGPTLTIDLTDELSGSDG